MVSKFEFVFIVSGVDPHSDDFEDIFFDAGCDDATLMLLKGSIVVKFTREHETYVDAVVSAYLNLVNAGIKVERFDPDFLVTQSEIAERAGISRQAVTNYVQEDRGRDFPPPTFRVLSNSPMWDWVDVSEWLISNSKLDRSVFECALVSRGINTFIESSDPRTALEGALHERISA